MVCRLHSRGAKAIFINNFDKDFCLWGADKPDTVVGNHEGEMIAFCTKPGRGTRLIPEGTLRGLQFMRTPDYVQIAGFIDQTKINILAGDYGGELDPHGADLVRAMPLWFFFAAISFVMAPLTLCLVAWEPSRRLVLLECVRNQQGSIYASYRMAQVRIPIPNT